MCSYHCARAPTHQQLCRWHADTCISKWSVAVLQQPFKKGSLCSAAAKMRFTVCTALSAALFHWTYSGELVMWQKPQPSANRWNSLLKRLLVLLHWELLSLTSLSGIPNLAIFSSDCWWHRWQYCDEVTQFQITLNRSWWPTSKLGPHIQTSQFGLPAKVI